MPPRVAIGGYYQAGQSCISVQRVFIQSEVYEDFLARLVKQVESLKVGDPLDPTVDVGPVIDAARWTASTNGCARQLTRARVLTGGTREDPFFWPTCWRTRSRDMKVCRQEIFGPVITVEPYQTFEEASPR